MQPTTASLLECFLHNLKRDAGGFDVHLQRGYAFSRASDLEIHVAEVVFQALNVGQHFETAIFARDQAHRHARHRSLDRHSSVHQRQRRTTHRGHRGRAVGCQHFGNQAHGVGEFVFFGQHRHQRPFSQFAVANVAAFWPAQWPRFAGRERWEIVMMHVAAGRFDAQIIQSLLVAGRTEGCDRQHLGLATGEQASAVNAGQHADFHADWANFFQLATINPNATVHNRGANFFFNQCFVGFANRFFASAKFFGRNIGAELGHHFISQCRSASFTSGFIAVVERILEAAAHPLGDLILQRGIGDGRHKLFLGFARFRHQFIDHADNWLQRFVTALDRFEHVGFGQFFGSGLNHHYGFGGASDHQIKAAVFHQAHHWIDHQHAVNVTHLDRGDRPFERNIRQRQRRRCSDNRQRAGVIHHVGGQRSDNHLHVVAVAFGKQRAQWSVGQARGQDGGFRGSAFALEERARDFASGVHFFFIIHRERKEIHAFTGRVRGRSRRQQHGVAVAYHHRATRQQCHAACFDTQCASGEFNRDAVNLLFVQNILQHRFWVFICGTLGTGACPARWLITRQFLTPSVIIQSLDLKHIAYPRGLVCQQKTSGGTIPPDVYFSTI